MELWRTAPSSFLSDVVYFVAQMPTELAETIRMLRRDYGIAYHELSYYLCETDPDIRGVIRPWEGAY